MPKSLPIDIFLAKKGVLPVIDVRSPGEFAHGHIPGAINLPLFSDEERAKVGTVYKKDGREQAILLGFELVGPKMADFSRKGMELAVAKRILVHCWRGGMRSGVVAWVFETVGLEVFTLQKGYKAYRNFVLKEFEKPLNLRIVGGETGTGKTEILHALRKKGEQVIDLEAIAAHRGSAFGALGQPAQPTSEQFENDLHHAISELDPAKIIWIEDESQMIGRCFIPQPFWEMKRTAPVFRLNLPFEIRVQRLVKDYGHFSKNELSESVMKIKKRLGGLNTKLALQAIGDGNIAEMVRIALRYYDKAYRFPHENRKFEGVHLIDSDSGDPELNAGMILDAIKNPERNSFENRMESFSANG